MVDVVFEREVTVKDDSKDGDRVGVSTVSQKLNGFSVKDLIITDLSQLSLRELVSIQDLMSVR